MSPLMWPWAPLNVALRKESVDRNLRTATLNSLPAVALRKESVDRNWESLTRSEPGKVALRKESVDRNRAGLLLGGKSGKSLSARRAWIEIAHGPVQGSFCFCRSPQGERG